MSSLGSVSEILIPARKALPIFSIGVANTGKFLKDENRRHATRHFSDVNSFHQC